ncbi:MAG: hypothetical protein K1X68_03170 [Saprospiraceae bacterium]|nr:hypothetical protein [Saprospiraceae bacterium]HMW37894.1 hypothetical protein [Saprospiraceae bacterium]HMX87362.1 hypothetical protein [Saprospiraceae bacterium]HMZ39189.1 hypothetical protein [Saprospiraceae bacterium]HNA64723.1 hypothetical protein [Saprospiraceae bacterium]
MSRSNYMILLFSLIISTISLSQVINITEKCNLATFVPDCSGMCTRNDGSTLWVVNDNDQKTEIYETDSNCTLLRTVKILNVSKTDWEELTADDKGNIYIGDFGNNSNNRRELNIYKIMHYDLDSTDQVNAGKITFHYTRQTAFPPPETELNYDMEAMIWLNGRLHLFSKNRTNPFSGWTYHYSLPDEPGTYDIAPVDSFNTGPGPSLLFWVTGASISADKQKLALLTHDKIWVFEPLDSIHFFNSPQKTYSLAHFSQKEGIAFAGKDGVYFADEVNKTISNGGKLYYGNMGIVSDNNDFSGLVRTTMIYAHEFMQLDLSASDLLEIFDAQGRRIIRQNLMQNHFTQMPVLVSGLYWVILKSGKEIRRMLMLKD